MKNLLYCRRTYIATLSILCLTAIGMYKGVDVSMGIASIAAALGASNAFEKVGIAKADASISIGYSSTAKE